MMKKINPKVPPLVFLITIMLAILPDTAIAAKGEKSEVVITPAVQEQIRKVDPNTKKRLEAAIGAGNIFIPYHFDGRAYDYGDSGDKKEREFWQKNIHHLINKNASDWINFARTQVIPPNSTVNWHYDWLGGGMMSVCPEIKLISIASNNKKTNIGWKDWYPEKFKADEFVFEYQAQIVGSLEGDSIPRFFRLGGNKYETVLIGLDSEYKISQVASHYAASTRTVADQIRLINMFINGILSHSTTDNDKLRLKQMIQDIKFQRSKVCIENLSIPDN